MECDAMMHETSLYPLKFEPVYKDYLWGGDRIVRHFNRDEPPGIYAESWEVSAHPDGMSVVAEGPLAGRALADLVEKFGKDLLGSKTRTDSFPLLIKLIDAKQLLSVQVHPNDETAARYGGEAKTEMWYVLAAEPDAFVYAGLKPGTTPKALKQAVGDETVEDLLVKVPVRQGDAVFIPGGRVHAIGSGCLLIEVQQTSNTTYRLYDWGRVGTDGKPRALHVEQALQVIDWKDEEEARVHEGAKERAQTAGFNPVYASEYFLLERAAPSQAVVGATDGTTFHVLFCAEGEARLESGGESRALVSGDTYLVPAAPLGYRLVPEAKGTELLRISLP